MRSIEQLVTSDSTYYTYKPSLNAREGLLYPICVGDFTYEPGYRQQRSQFDSFLLKVILDGQLTIKSDGQVFSAKQDDVVLLDCYKPHAYWSESGWRSLWVHFDGLSARSYYNWIVRTNGNVFSTWNIRKILKNLNDVYETFHSEQVVNEPHIALSLTKALTAMTESVEQSRSIQNNAEAINEVIYYINEHPSENLTVEQMAQMASFSKYHFIRIFQETIGMTPRQYVIASRMDYARYLLKSTSLPVKEVGYNIGYTSGSMFCATFKKIHGVTPSEYRDEAGQV